MGATVVNMRFVKPLDETLIRELANTHNLFVTLEENVIAGGAGSGVNEYLASQQITIPTLNLGLPDQYIDHGSQAQLLADCGLDADGIVKTVMSSSHYQLIANEEDENNSKIA